MSILATIEHAEKNKENLHLARSIAIELADKVRTLRESSVVGHDKSKWELDNIYYYLLEVQNITDYIEASKYSIFHKVNTPYVQLDNCIQDLTEWSYNHNIKLS